MNINSLVISCSRFYNTAAERRRAELRFVYPVVQAIRGQTCGGRYTAFPPMGERRVQECTVKQTSDVMKKHDREECNAR
jgi:hypothetical protein